MAISLTHIGSATSKAAPTSLSITVPAGGVPTGACIFTLSAMNTASTLVGTASDTNNTYQNPAALAVGPTGASQNNSRMSYAYNCIALVSGNTIVVVFGATSSSIASTAFYATGLATTDPLDTTSDAAVAFISGTPKTIQMAAAPATAGSLVIAGYSWRGVPADFVQDSTNAAYGTPPNAAGTTGAAGASNCTVAGGSIVSSSQLTYTPGDLAAGASLIIAAFAPAAAAAVWFDMFGGFRDPRREPFRAVGGSPT